jgi:hypothetical protein
MSFAGLAAWKRGTSMLRSFPSIWQAGSTAVETGWLH